MELKQTEFTYALKSGRAFNGAHRDAGKIKHIIRGDYTTNLKEWPSWAKALCGTEPGRSGNGWNFSVPAGVPICEKCQKKFEKQQP